MSDYLALFFAIVCLGAIIFSVGGFGFIILGLFDSLYHKIAKDYPDDETPARKYVPLWLGFIILSLIAIAAYLTLIIAIIEYLQTIEVN